MAKNKNHTKNIFRIALPIILLSMSDTHIFAFKSPEHQDVTQNAANYAGTIGAKDIAFYENLIVSWSWGIGQPGFGKPAEQLAHSSDQNGTYFFNGGAFDVLQKRIIDRYNNFNFNDETPRNEGAYVLMGTCAHLIEDQASMPHAANIHHGASDNFETFSVDDGFDGFQGNVSPDQAYIQSLITTQNIIPNYIKSGSNPPAQYWYTNVELYKNGDHTRSPSPYVGDFKPSYTGQPNSLWGADLAPLNSTIG